MNVSSMKGLVARMSVENAIENSKENRLVSRASADLSQALIGQQNAEKEQENSLKATSGDIAIASSAVKAGEKSVMAGVEVKKFAERLGTEGELTKNVEAGQAEQAKSQSTDSTKTEGGEGKGDNKAATTAAVMKSSLGNGMTVGQRFGEKNTEALLKPDVGAKIDSAGKVESKGDWDKRVGSNLKASGLTDGEVAQVWDKAKDGKFDTKDAVNFMYDNRTPPAQVANDQFRQKLQGEIQGQVVSLTTQHLGTLGKQHSTNGQRLGEAAGEARETGDKARSNTVEVNEKAGDLNLKSMRQRRGAPTS